MEVYELTSPRESMASPLRSRTMSPAHSDSEDRVPTRTETTPTVSDDKHSEALAAPKDKTDVSGLGKQPRLCSICGTDGKYKCARSQCTAMYCSVGCSRIHHAKHLPVPEVPPKAAAPEPETPKTFQQHDPYKILLDHSADIQRLFKKHPDLKTALVDIQRATDPPAESQMARQSALPFGRSTFVANGARGNDRQQPPWSRDEGLRNGAAALRAARTDPGDKGDGVREYCELVLYLLSKPAGSQLATAVRQEVLDEETKTISQLMEQEKELD